MVKKYNWQKIADHVNQLDFGINQIAVIEIKNKKYCVGKHQDKLFAFSYKCPHAGGLLSEGFINPLGQIVCPLHRYKYDLSNGRNVSGEGYYLKNWPVEQREDGVFMGLDNDRLFGLF
jgi:3-phenylpropionate/trans-cinnamate dioxygenase ferredoxin subunit